MTLEQALADAREEAATLARYGQRDVAQALEALLDKLAPPLREFLTWHDEKGAALLSGKGTGYFATRFTEWEARGLARAGRKRGERHYREVVIPKRRHLGDVQADAARVAREDAA